MKRIDIVSEAIAETCTGDPMLIMAILDELCEKGYEFDRIAELVERRFSVPRYIFLDTLNQIGMTRHFC